MGTKVGKIILDVDADGTFLERDIRREARKGGANAGKDFSRSFSRNLVLPTSRFAAFGKRTEAIAARSGRRSGLLFAARFNAGVRTAFAGLRRDFDRANRRLVGNLGDAFRDLGTLFLDGLPGARGLQRQIIRLSQSGRNFANTFRVGVNLALADFSTLVNERVRQPLERFGRLIEQRAIRPLRRFGTELSERFVSSVNRFRVVVNDRVTNALEPLRRRLRSVSENLREFGDSISTQISPFNSVGRAVRNYAEDLRGLAPRLRILRREIGLVNQANREARAEQAASRGGIFSRFFRGFGRGGGAAGGGATDLLEGFGDALDGVNKKSGGFFSRWKTLPRGFRRLSFFILLFANLAESIAVLGSATGSGLTVLLGSAQRLLSGLSAGAVILLTTLLPLAPAIGVVIAAFRGFSGELDELPPKTQKFAKAAKDLGEPLKALRESIQERFFDGLTKPFVSLTEKLLPVAERGLGRIADVINDSLLDVFERLGSDRGLFNLEALFRGFAPILRDLLSAGNDFGAALGEIFIIALPFARDFAGFLADISRTFKEYTQSAEGRREIREWLERGSRIVSNFVKGVINLGAAFGNIFRAGAPQIDRFNAYLFDIIERFREWTGSLEGQNALAEWFKNGERVFIALEKVLISAAKTLNGLVDEDAIRRFEDFAGSIERLLPDLGSFLEFLGDLNLLGIAAELLEGFFDGLAPIAEILSPIVRSLSDLVILIFGFSTILNPLTLLLTPLFLGLQVTSGAIEKLREKLSPLLEVFKEASDLVGGALTDAFIKVGEAVLRLVLDSWGVLIPEGQDVVKFLSENLVPIIQTRVIPWIENFAEKVVELVDEFRTEWIPVLKDLWDAFKNDLLPALRDGIDGFRRFMDRIGEIRQKAQPAIDALRKLADLFGLIPRNFTTNVTVNRTGNGGGGGGGNLALASGGILSQRRQIAPGVIAGEAGLEAVVPLRRPLSQVDPSVRELSAIARGLYSKTGSYASTGRGVTVAEGAITVLAPYSDPRNVAVAVLDELAEELR